MFISFVCWIVVGAIVGAIAGKFVNSGDDDPKLGIVIAVIAAAIGAKLSPSGIAAAWRHAPDRRLKSSADRANKEYSNE